MRIHLPSRERQGWAAVALVALLAAACSILPGLASAQSFIWGGTGSTTSTSDYSSATNWSNPLAGPPPVLPPQSAVFGATGSSTITIGAGPMLPDSWTFNTDSQSYTISGNPVDFSLSGPTGGLINNANTGQTVTISAAINDGIGGAIMVQQLGNSTLVLGGVNGYSAGTLISAGTVQVTNANSLGTGTVTLNGGTLQMQSPTLTSVAFSNNFAINAPGGTVDLDGASVNLSGVILNGNSGSGVLNVIDSSGGGNALQLSGINTYTGGTKVTAATLQVTNNSSVGTGTVTLDNAEFQAQGPTNLTCSNNFNINTSSAGSAIDSTGTILTLTGNISDGNGPGKLTILDSTFSGGAVVLDGTNTYTGGTFICTCAGLQLGDSTHTGSIVGTVYNEGVFNVVNANTSGITLITNDASSGPG